MVRDECLCEADTAQSTDWGVRVALRLEPQFAIRKIRGGNDGQMHENMHFNTKQDSPWTPPRRTQLYALVTCTNTNN